jgi:tetratricopeptide (TPR) repeat protein
MPRTSTSKAKSLARACAVLGAILAVTVGIALAPWGALAAAKSSKSGGEPDAKPEAFELGVGLVSDGKFAEARASFEQANRKRRNDPEILNMLAYTQRKTGHVDLAIENYRKALKLQPDFPEAREYLGEAYLQAALAQLDWLEKAGGKAKSQHGQLLRALHDAASGRQPAPENSVW